MNVSAGPFHNRMIENLKGVPALGKMHLKFKDKNVSLPFYDNKELSGKSIAQLRFSEFLINDEKMCEGWRLPRTKKLDQLLTDTVKRRMDIFSEADARSLFKQDTYPCAHNLHNISYSGNGGSFRIRYENEVSENVFLLNFEGVSLYFKIPGKREIGELDGTWDFTFGTKNSKMHASIKVPNYVGFKSSIKRDKKLLSTYKDLITAIESKNIDKIKRYYGQVKIRENFVNSNNGKKSARYVMKSRFELEEQRFLNDLKDLKSWNTSKFVQRLKVNSLDDVFLKYSKKIVSLLEVDQDTSLSVKFNRSTRRITSIYFSRTHGFRMKLFVKYESGKPVITINSLMVSGFKEDGL
jgi:hypothetical protein